MEEKPPMSVSAVEFFNKMDDEDLLQIHNMGQLKSLCNALSLDLQYSKDKLN